MVLLESGPAKVDRTYWFVVAVLFVAFGGYFVYDGAYGYPNYNRAEARKQLLRWTDAEVPLPLKPSEKDVQTLLDQWRSADRSVTRIVVHEALGEPIPPKKGEPATDRVERFASLYGLVTVPYDIGGRAQIDQIQWEKWGKTKEEIQGQFYWAIIPFVAAIYFLLRAYKAATLRAVIDDDALIYGGVRVPFADMVSFRDYNRKGWVDLYHKSPAGEKRIRIDNQKIAKFNEIAELVCQKTGFENPILAAEHAEEPADSSPPAGDTEDEAAADAQHDDTK